MYSVDLGVFEPMTNGKIYIMHPIFVIFYSKRLEWAGHVRRTEGCLIKKGLTEKPSEKRLIERSRQNWIDTVNKDLKK